MSFILDELEPMLVKMTKILMSLVGFIAFLCMIQDRDLKRKEEMKDGMGDECPCLTIFFSCHDCLQKFTPESMPNPNDTKLQLESFSFKYTLIWVLFFTIIIAGKIYESMDEWGYVLVCVGLALPFLVQPILYPMPLEKDVSIFKRYSFKANVWIAIFSFVGNYWYTHYFYAVLKAKYNFPAHRLNDVPIALYFATHFYFMTYHTLSNKILRYIESSYVPGFKRTLLFWSATCAFAYFTAYGETLSISAFPCYTFEDRELVYVIGSAFYGIYFLVSYPIFYSMPVNASLYQYIMEAMGASMLVLTLLDLCRLFYGGPPIPLFIGGIGYYVSPNECKF